MKTPYIGQLDHKIQVIKETLVQNALGEQKPTQSIIAEPWAFMEESGGNEDVEGKVRHLINRKYTIRYSSDILKNGSDYLVLDNGIKYEIYHVMAIGRKQHLQLLVNIYE